MTNAGGFEFEPYCIEANARTMAEFAAAMMRTIAQISVENYGIALASSDTGNHKNGYHY